MDVRLRVLSDTPEEVFAKKRYPCIAIENGYTITLTDGFQKEINDVSYGVNAGNTDLVDVTTEKVIDVTYGYKISFFVLYRSHCDYMELEFLKLFPHKFLLEVEGESGAEKVGFVHEGQLIKMDTYADNQKVYRRDLVVKAQLSFAESIVENLLRPFTGLQLEEDSSIV
jgi:hypothetical protein